MKKSDMPSRFSGSGLSPLKIAVLYAVIGGIWIFASDRLLGLLVSDQQFLPTLQTFKGWFYALVTGLLLYYLIGRYASDRRKAEEELIESEERYHSLFQNSIDAVMLTSPEGSILAANPEACRIFQMTEEEICRGGRAGLVDMTDPNLPLAIEERERTGKVRGELTFVRKDGSKFPGEISSAIYTDRYGNRRTAMIIRDVSERRQSEQLTTEALNYAKTMLEASPAGIITYNAASGAAVSANEAAATIIGATLEQVKQQNFRKIESWKVSGLLAAAEKALASGKEELMDTHFFTTFGREVWLSCRFVPFRYGGEEQLLLLFLDITERRKAEEAVRKSEERFRSLFENMLGGFAYCRMIFEDRQPRDFMYLEVNSAFERLTGLKDVVGRKVSEVIPGIREAYPELFEIFGRVSLSGRPERFELYLEPIKAWLNISVYSTEKEHFITVFDNITEHKKAEEQLRHAQKMEAIGQLAGGVAHDFNNILSAIIGYGSLTQMKMKDDDPLKHNVEQILASAERASQLTRSLLAFGRKQIITMKRLDLNDVIKRVESLLVRLIGEDIEFGTRLSKTALTVMADSGQIEQVLMNLATNAKDAMPDGGTLAIRTEKGKLDAEFIKMHGYGKAGEYAVISVTDTGSGMTEETRQRIFEPFFTTKETGKGTGLGLAIAYGIVKQHDGYITAYSAPGRGTTFMVYLPLVAAAPEEKREETGGYPAGGTEKILVAEDDTALRKLSESILKEFGYRVVTAIDGEDAITEFRKDVNGIDLIVLDLIMPKKNGREVYDEIKKMKPGIKVLFASGYTADIIHKKGILDEGLDFMMKPISPRDLVRKVREILDRKQ
jgi:two-component system NtrC family sensor kinase